MRMLLIWVICLLACPEGLAQGCSDAGFCTIGALKNSAQKDQRPQHSIGASVTYGLGDRHTMLIIPQAELKYGISRRGYVEARVPFNIASGPLGRRAGLGDPLLSYTYNAIDKAVLQLQLTGGIRVGTGRADATDHSGRPLPMPYQNSLGTTDVILGISAAAGKYLALAAGYQQPVLHYNENGYLPLNIEMPGTDHFASRRLMRRGDVLLRVEGRYNRDRFGFSGGPLFIYHLGNDRITLPHEEELELEGSGGLTLNLSGSVYYRAGRFRFDIAAGTPLIFRKYRPDGLTREYVITPRVSYSLRKNE